MLKNIKTMYYLNHIDGCFKINSGIRNNLSLWKDILFIMKYRITSKK